MVEGAIGWLANHAIAKQTTTLWPWRTGTRAAAPPYERVWAIANLRNGWYGMIGVEQGGL
jgi:hypothetical protein